MVFGIILVSALALIAGLAAAVFQTESARSENVQDELKREKILDCLPGENCGVCGYSCCSDTALAIARGDAPVSACLVGGASAAQAIAVVLGWEDQVRTRMRAQVMCSGTDGTVRKKYIYDSGAEDCLAAAKLGGGDKLCKYACVGLGSCVSVCPFVAISIKDGTAVVDYAACNGCGLCVSACPKHIIELIPYDTYNWVGCMSRESGARSAEGCQSGCTGCGICARVCPEDAVVLKQSRLAAIDYTKCSGCGMCFDACPQGVIWKSDAFGADGLVFTKGSKKNTV